MTAQIPNRVHAPLHGGVLPIIALWLSLIVYYIIAVGVSESHPVSLHLISTVHLTMSSERTTSSVDGYCLERNYAASARYFFGPGIQQTINIDVMQD